MKADQESFHQYSLVVMKEVFVGKNLLLIMSLISAILISKVTLKIRSKRKFLKSFHALWVCSLRKEWRQWLHILQGVCCSQNVEWSIKVMPQYFPADKSLCWSVQFLPWAMMHSHWSLPLDCLCFQRTVLNTSFFSSSSIFFSPPFFFCPNLLLVQPQQKAAHFWL